jgi:hypothetical protein
MTTQFSSESALAGYVAGVAGLLVGHPLDSIKVMIQNGNALPLPSSVEIPAVAPSSRLTTIAPTLPTRLSAGGVQKRGFSEMACTFDGKTIGTTTSATSATVTKVKGRSILNLYSGIGAPLVTVGVVQSINFFLFDNFRCALRQCESSTSTHRDEDSLLHIGLAAAMAGGMVSTVTSPLVMLKTKQQMMMWTMKQAVRDTWQMPLKVRNTTSWM